MFSWYSTIFHPCDVSYSWVTNFSFLSKSFCSKNVWLSVSHISLSSPRTQKKSSDLPRMQNTSCSQNVFVVITFFEDERLLHWHVNTRMLRNIHEVGMFKSSNSCKSDLLHALHFCSGALALEIGGGRKISKFSTVRMLYSISIQVCSQI